jgi:hypothetical protein
MGFRQRIEQAKALRAVETMAARTHDVELGRRVQTFAATECAPGLREMTVSDPVARPAAASTQREIGL